MSDENRRVTKVKRSDKSIIIHHHHENKNYDKDTDMMLRHEPALPSFHDAFNALVSEVQKILKLDAKYINGHQSQSGRHEVGRRPHH